MPNDSEGEICPWEIETARRVAKEFRYRSRSLRDEPLEDLVQEALAHWIVVRRQFVAQGEAHARAYMAKVVRN